MLIENEFVSDPPRLSVTVTPKLNGPPAAGGVPLSPPPALSDSQAGSAGLPADHVYPAPEPPEAASAFEYGTLASAFGSVEAVVMLGPGVTVSVNGEVL